MKENQKELGKGKISSEDKLDEELFAYEVSSKGAKLEVIEELPTDDDLEDYNDQTLEEENEEESPPKKTIRIISEKDMEIKEISPPNYSPYLVCALHFKNQPYKKRKLLKVKRLEDN
ncbi:MAG TPA: hypothetical protein VMZ29_12465 [Candidatus Bathyarchaeia archaeon]|nr:hypothetical protein [Candidatus Bathyarchaeia archaeon]